MTFDDITVKDPWVGRILANVRVSRDAADRRREFARVKGLLTRRVGFCADGVTPAALCTNEALAVCVAELERRIGGRRRTDG